MHSLYTLSLLSTAVIVAAQSPGSQYPQTGLPACGQTCFDSEVQQGCGKPDGAINCVCTTPAPIENMKGCLKSSSCSQLDAEKIIEFIGQTCPGSTSISSSVPPSTTPEPYPPSYPTTSPSPPPSYPTTTVSPPPSYPTTSPPPPPAYSPTAITTHVPIPYPPISHETNTTSTYCPPSTGVTSNTPPSMYPPPAPPVVGTPATPSTIIVTGTPPPPSPQPSTTMVSSPSQASPQPAPASTSSQSPGTSGGIGQSVGRDSAIVAAVLMLGTTVMLAL